MNVTVKPRIEALAQLEALAQIQAQGWVNSGIEAQGSNRGARGASKLRLC